MITMVSDHWSVSHVVTVMMVNVMLTPFSVMMIYAAKNVIMAHVTMVNVSIIIRQCDDHMVAVMMVSAMITLVNARSMRSRCEVDAIITMVNLTMFNVMLTLVSVTSLVNV